jgi:zinc/manganese transport system permease protein
MMLPAASARFWARDLPQTLAAAMGIGLLASLIGLEWSYYASLPAGPAIVLSASVIFFISILFGTRGGIYRFARR